MSGIAIIGGGYVGLVSAACFARLGHDVTCIEIDEGKLKALQRDRLPIREPGLTDLWIRYRQEGKLRVTCDYKEALREVEFVFLAVGTPPRAGGAADLRQVLAATVSLAKNLSGRTSPTVIVKSTVPLGTAELVSKILQEQRPRNTPPVVSNPEFLREGQAVFDFLRPSRTVIGAFRREAGEAVAELYRPLRRPVIFCSPRTAEMVKYASNAFLCTKVSFMNEIASLCEEAGVDVVDVGEALGLDNRIGHSYLGAGLGWGGSCLPKDVEALIWTASKLGVPTPMLRSAVRINRRQPRLAVSKLQSLVGPLEGATVAVWGLAFKPNSDDVRESPALALVRLLLDEGCEVRAFDPLAMEAASLHFPEVTYCSDVYDAATGADAIVVATDWADFEEVDLAALRARVAKPVIVDARNALNANRVAEAGFAYTGIGRPTQSKKVANNGHREVPLPPHGRKRKTAAKDASELATYASRE